MCIRDRDKTADFQQYVIDYFAEEYQNGRTPNPCIICNPTVKFKALADAADELGYDWIATGHYAKLEKQNGEVLLKKGNSAKRDQSYMLYRLNQRILSRLLLPLAELEKDEVRAIAANLGVSAASKPDSQENCFIVDNDYAGYIERHYGKSMPGDFISPEGVPCGKHKGIIHYTVGQRKGLGIALGLSLIHISYFYRMLRTDIGVAYREVCRRISGMAGTDSGQGAADWRTSA